jgi:formamidase
MGKEGIRYAAKVSLDKPAAEQECLHVRPPSASTCSHPLHPLFHTFLTHLPGTQNRWHPSNPSYASIAPNEVVKIECVDWTGGQIGNNDSANDVRDVDLSKIHYLTGPFDIETAEPGDVLVVEIQDVQPLEEAPWGFTGIFGKANGGGFLDEIYPEP